LQILFLSGRPAQGEDSALRPASSMTSTNSHFYYLFDQAVELLTCSGLLPLSCLSLSLASLLTLTTLLLVSLSLSLSLSLCLSVSILLLTSQRPKQCVKHWSE
jgi:hypothetical protein